jgi:CRP/FNR family transcriptional regulator
MTIGSDLWFERGDVISAAGEPDDRLLVVRDGLLALQIDRARATRPVWVALVGPGGTVGESALLDSPSPRSWSAVALVPSRVAEVRVAVLEPSEQESLLPLAVESLAARVREQEDRATYLRTASASHRVAGCLCDLARLLDPRHDSAVVEIERRILTQQQMALYIGCARDAVNKAIARFAVRGWLELHPSRICVTDLPALRAFSKPLVADPEHASARPRRRSELADRLQVLAERQRAPRPQSTRGAA